MSLTDVPMYVALLVGGLVLAGAVLHFRETFVPEFLDQANVKKTADRKTSSYSQDTNHVRPNGAFDAPMVGMESPFRVNIWDSYIP